MERITDCNKDCFCKEIVLIIMLLVAFWFLLQYNITIIAKAFLRVKEFRLKNKT